MHISTTTYSLCVSCVRPDTRRSDDWSVGRLCFHPCLFSVELLACEQDYAETFFGHIYCAQFGACPDCLAMAEVSAILVLFCLIVFYIVHAGI